MGEYMDFGLLYLLTQRFYLICYRYCLHLCLNILCWKYPNIVENKVPTRKNSSDERQARNQQNCEQLLKKAQSEIDILRSEKQVLESEKQDALSRDQNHARVQQQLEDLLKKAQSEIDRLHAEKQVLESEKQDAFNRLSTLMSSKLRDNNPNIADLSDQFRPTKIGEQFTELYDNEWTDAFSVLEQQYTEKQGITFLLDIIMEAYVFCEHELTASWNYVEKIFLTEGDTVTAKCLKDARKKKILDDISEKKREFSTDLSTHYTKYPSFANNDAIQKYISKCVQLCLLMNANDPPVVIECPGWHSHIWTQGHTRMPMVNGKPTSRKAWVVIEIDEQPMPRQDFDKAVFKEYTCRGPYVEYFVWPIMYLHRNGPMLAKGIAQGNHM